MSNNNPDLISTGEAAKLLGVSLRTIQLWVESNTLRAWKTVGGHRRLSRSEVEAMATQQADVIKPKDNTCKVLIIEDDHDLNRLYQLQLQSFGLPLQLDAVNDGFQGLLRAGEWEPDIIITDLLMPNMDGFAMLEALQQHRLSKQPFIIAITALSPEDVKDRGGLPDSIVLMHKPLDFNKLKNLIREQFEI
ncbi:excisionase family DNA-binding protein [Neisseriaceae bacterium TC5R-5]|nr:excisionase family DNA-binding protein [Neisseriaceae bacterium TC5R-5]